MGSGDSRLAFGRPTTVILLAGLQGSGKTTSAAKLARRLKGEGRRPALVACDLQRPAAVEQLSTLGRQVEVPVYTPDSTGERTPEGVARAGLEAARAEGRDTLIVDTAGRLAVDEALMAELVRVRDTVRPHSVLLVVDAMTGQDAVATAQRFQEAVSFDGVVMTKLDGDARGGAALSIKAVTGVPILFASSAEKVGEGFDLFHPDRMASRILGMGDVLSLIEKAERTLDEEGAEGLEARMRKGQFTFDDFLTQLRAIQKMGPLTGLLKLIPGLGKQLQGVQVDEGQVRRVEAMILSMTPRERRNPGLINGSRKRRIAAGSGTDVREINQLLVQFKQMQKMMRQFGRGKMPRGLPQLPV
jgi:signal recognition particle subunit SRP54